ncbi:hypothetical protein PFISCL1PPCAC_4065, partial [Pristionchus fissidentatus]
GFTYTTASELENSDLRGTFANYGGGGFVLYLNQTNKNAARDSIAFLKANQWIGRGTRLIVVEFAVYNGNVNLFCVIKLMFELPATGGVIPKASFNTMRFIRYVSTVDNVVLVCEGIFCAFTLFFIVDALMDFAKTRLDYFKKFWNIVDLVLIGLSLACIDLSNRRTLLACTRINKLLDSICRVPSTDDVVNTEENYNNIVAILFFFACMKV